MTGSFEYADGTGSGLQNRCSGFTVSLGDTWEYGPTHPATYTTFGTGCAGTAGTPTLASLTRPWLGETQTVDLSNLPATGAVLLNLGFSDSSFGALSLPFPLGVIGMPGCSLLTSPDLGFPLTNTGGTAQWSQLIPNAPQHLGLTFFNQGFVLDANANPLGVIVTNGGRGVIGGK